MIKKPFRLLFLLLASYIFVGVVWEIIIRIFHLEINLNGGLFDKNHAIFVIGPSLVIAFFMYKKQESKEADKRPEEETNKK